jgi:hypothetical protein
MTKKKEKAAPGAYDLEQKNPLTREESRHLLDIIHAELTNGGDTAPPTAFLLLLNALAFEDGGGERFTLWCDARSMFALDVDGPYYALENSLGAALADLRKGGAR